MVLVPWIHLPRPCANLPNLLADEDNHTSRYFGWVMSCRYFNNFPVSSSKILSACSLGLVGYSSKIAWASSVMACRALRGIFRRCIRFDRAWAYFDRVVGPSFIPLVAGFATINFLMVDDLLLTMVSSGFSIVTVDTLGAKNVLGEICMSPELLPTLGSGTGSLKVTLYWSFLQYL